MDTASSSVRLSFRSEGTVALLAISAAAALAGEVTTFRIGRGGEPVGRFAIERREGGWIHYDEVRGDVHNRGDLKLDGAGAIVKASFAHGKAGAEPEPLEVTIDNGDVEVAAAGTRRKVDVPLSQRGRLKPGKVFAIVATLNPAVLLGVMPLAVASGRPDSEVGVVIVEPEEGVSDPPLFRTMRLVRDRKPRTLHGAKGEAIDAVAVDVEIDRTVLMSVVCGKDGAIYAYRIVAKDSPRFGETGFSSALAPGRAEP